LNQKSQLSVGPNPLHLTLKNLGPPTVSMEDMSTKGDRIAALLGKLRIEQPDASVAATNLEAAKPSNVWL